MLATSEMIDSGLWTLTDNSLHDRHLLWSWVHAIHFFLYTNSSAVWSSIPDFPKLRDLCNSLVVQNTLTPPPFHHFTPVLQEIHWLSSKSRIILRILPYTFKAIHNLAPPYLSDLLPASRFRSSSSMHLTVPSIMGSSLQPLCSQTLELTSTGHLFMLLLVFIV